MREEKVTINILNWLESNGWSIVCYDFPQSGTGTLIHPNSDENQMTKNKGGIIPDIIAVKKKTAVFFENKDRYVESDFEKIRKIKSSGKYSEGLSRLLKQFASDTLFFGIAYASSINDDQRGLKNLENIDFLLTVNINSSINILSDPFKLFSE